MKRESDRQIKARDQACPVPVRFHLAALLALVVSCWPAIAAQVPGAAQFRKEIQPILAEFCYDCHADGANKGGVGFDEFKSDQALLEDHDLWWKALKNLRADLMPPPKKPQPTGRGRGQFASGGRGQTCSSAWRTSWARKSWRILGMRRESWRTSD